MARLTIEERLYELENMCNKLTNGKNTVIMPNKSGTIATLDDIKDHNIDTSSHADIRAMIDDIPKTEVSNLSTDTEAMGKALNSVQLNPNIEGTLAYKVDQLGHGLSDGMKKVADAITEKGVETQATDSLSTMANNILNIKSNNTDGEVVLNKIISKDEKLVDLPYNFYEGCAVTLNGEIHILGSRYSSETYTNHYKLNKDTNIWERVSTLPYNFYEGCAVTLNGEIHILGSRYSSETYTNHYKLNKDTNIWERVSTLPYSFYNGCAVTLNGEIHILGSIGATYTNHYKLNKDTNIWESVSTLPYSFYNGCAVTLNGEIHILGGSYSYSGETHTNHYKLNKDTNIWESVSTLPYKFHYGCAVTLNGEIHILGGGSANTNHYKLNKDTNIWESVSTLPYKFYDGCEVTLNGEIHILGSGASEVYTNHYIIKSSDIPYLSIKMSSSLKLITSSTIDSQSVSGDLTIYIIPL